MKTTVQIYTHPDCLLHENRPHVERPERLTGVLDSLKTMDDLTIHHVAAACVEDIMLVHQKKYVDQLTAVSPQQGNIIVDSGDTVMSPHSLQAAYLAAGAVVQATKDVIGGKVKRAFCAVRPPGHHAEPDQAMGFCFFNNIAVGAKVALDTLGLNKVAIVDFDVHHGNGTETVAKSDPRILFISSHHGGIYPGTGNQDYPPNVINIPLGARINGRMLIDAYEQRVFPALISFAPELIFISAGFDGHCDDPIGGWKLTASDYGLLTEKLVGIADQVSGGRIVSALEGGYNLVALAESVKTHVTALMR